MSVNGPSKLYDARAHCIPGCPLCQGNGSVFKRSRNPVEVTALLPSACYLSGIDKMLFRGKPVLSPIMIG